MHHILSSMVRFTPIGGIEQVNGKQVQGALNIFYEQLNNGLPISKSATAFLSQGFMPTFMFALPAICCAIYFSARKENRSKIKGLLISAILVAVVTGISEPTEFYSYLSHQAYIYSIV